MELLFPVPRRWRGEQHAGWSPTERSHAHSACGGGEGSEGGKGPLPSEGTSAQVQEHEPLAQRMAGRLLSHHGAVRCGMARASAWRVMQALLLSAAVVVCGWGGLVCSVLLPSGSSPSHPRLVLSGGSGGAPLPSADVGFCCSVWLPSGVPCGVCSPGCRQSLGLVVDDALCVFSRGAKIGSDRRRSSRRNITRPVLLRTESPGTAAGWAGSSAESSFRRLCYRAPGLYQGGHRCISGRSGRLCRSCPSAVT